jgi:2-keto-4-pentenoate hydratase/2-oxohepta-3-ene-1,7-dioic acid hydratase in catechol pathway
VAVIGAAGAIAGFTGANAWYAPDLPGAKSYDFALSLGPVIVTPDEYAAGPGWGARLDGASLNTALRPGDLLVHPLGPGAPVSRGEAVEVTVDGIGVLKNRVAS